MPRKRCSKMRRFPPKAVLPDAKALIRHKLSCVCTWKASVLDSIQEEGRKLNIEKLGKGVDTADMRWKNVLTSMMLQEDSPQIDRDTDEEVVQFVDKVGKTDKSCSQQEGVGNQMTEEQARKIMSTVKEAVTDETATFKTAKKTQDAASRKKVTDFMCHDTSTADRFYATMPDAKEAAVIRTIMAKALECPPSQSGGGVGSSEEETTSEEDDTVVLYQDSSSGTSSSQDEEFRAELKRRKERRREEDKEGEEVEAEGEEAEGEEAEGEEDKESEGEEDKESEREEEAEREKGVEAAGFLTTQRPPFEYTRSTCETLSDVQLDRPNFGYARSNFKNVLNIKLQNPLADV
ncbi:hypothetical protein KUCAC02_032928, partial [Chaenocephalus aceratus]